jgi:hypothetical protein
MATQPEHKPNGRPPMADDEASAGRIDAGVSYSRPENAVAAQTLMVGWANDMFTGTQDDGIYLDPSQEFTLDTVAGEATQFALPNSLTKPFLLNPLQALVPLGNAFFTFEPACVFNSMAVAGCNGRWLPDAPKRPPPRRRRRRKPSFNGKLHTKHGVIS